MWYYIYNTIKEVYISEGLHMGDQGKSYFLSGLKLRRGSKNSGHSCPDVPLLGRRLHNGNGDRGNQHLTWVLKPELLRSALKRSAKNLPENLRLIVLLSTTRSTLLCNSQTYHYLVGGDTRGTIA